MRGGAENAPASVVDGGEDVLALAGESDGLDEVDRQDRLGLGAQQVDPCDGCPSRARVDVLGLEDPPHGRSSDRATQQSQFTVNAPVASGGVLSYQA
jgi:hypothetical protein